MAELQSTSYDQLPYVSQAFAQTHPDRLAVLAKLFGMSPPSLENCRVLELGCAGGGNLIPMAVTMPSATFVGIDLSARQIAGGQAAAAALGLRNVDLRQQSIADVDESTGMFDYIVAHGVYSWVPRDVQEAILAVCKRNLAPNGVAYVSYNTYPGWRMRGMIRDMMLYHAQQFGDAPLRVQQARALLDFLVQSVPTENNPYGILLKQEVEGLRNAGDWYVFHEHLEDINEPLYFHQFAERAAAGGLQYLGEAEFDSMLASNFPPQVEETLRKIAPDIIRMEQYMDFVRNRLFRQTLLVHQELSLNRNLDWRTMQGFHVASPARPTNASPDLRPNAIEHFRTPRGAGVATAVPIVKAAMTVLSELWPQGMAFGDLCSAARRRVESGSLLAQDGSAAAADAQVLGADLLRCFASSLVELRIRPARFARQAGSRPRASVVSRLQADKSSRVTNLRHEDVNLDEFNRQLLRHLDGSRDRSALLAVMEELVNKGELSINRQGRAVTDPTAIRQILGEALDDNLPKLASAALLEEDADGPRTPG